MLFTSFQFAVDFPLILITYYLLPRRNWQVVFLVIVGMLMYGIENWQFFLLLSFSAAFTGVTSYLASQPERPTRRGWLVTGVVTCLSILIFFKYKGLIFSSLAPLDFLLKDWTSAHQVCAAILLLPLPVGISFYTFHAISLLVDAHRRPAILGFDRMARVSFPEHFLKTFLYITFFPQLVAGPIVKGASFYPQVSPKKWRDIPWIPAARALIWGYFLKMVIADNLQELTAPLDGKWHSSPADACWAMMLGYSAQIFADFAGYSLIALGLAKLLGYELPQNFNMPYISASFSDFWRRWHMSLSLWLREYLYYPLGGNRKGRLRTYFNLMIVMFLGGLWHGPAWRFAIWGLWHGAALACEKMLKDFAESHPDLLFSKLIEAIRTPLLKPLRVLFVFSFITVSWLFFRLENAAQVWEFLGKLFDHGPSGCSAVHTLTYIFFFMVILFHFLKDPALGINLRESSFLGYSATPLLLGMLIQGFQYLTMSCSKTLSLIVWLVILLYYALASPLGLGWKGNEDAQNKFEAYIGRIEPYLLGFLLFLIFFSPGKQNAFIYFQF